MMSYDSNLGLTEVPSQIGDLRALVSLNNISGSGSFSMSSTELQIYLAKNLLTSRSLSDALFNLDNLRVLVLRDNLLEELPFGVGRLTGLKELSLGGNRLVSCLVAFFCSNN